VVPGGSFLGGDDAIAKIFVHLLCTNSCVQKKRQENPESRVRVLGGNEPSRRSRSREIRRPFEESRYSKWDLRLSQGVWGQCRIHGSQTRCRALGPSQAEGES